MCVHISPARSAFGRRLDSEQSGLANLARVQDPKKGNTAFSKVEINSEMTQKKALKFNVNSNRAHNAFNCAGRFLLE